MGKVLFDPRDLREGKTPGVSEKYAHIHADNTLLADRQNTPIDEPLFLHPKTPKC